MHHQWVLRITNPQLGYAGLQIRHNKRIIKSHIFAGKFIFFTNMETIIEETAYELTLLVAERIGKISRNIRQTEIELHLRHGVLSKAKSKP